MQATVEALRRQQGETAAALQERGAELDGLRAELAAAAGEAAAWQHRCKSLQGEADERELELARSDLQAQVGAGLQPEERGGGADCGTGLRLCSCSLALGPAAPALGSPFWPYPCLPTCLPPPLATPPCVHQELADALRLLGAKAEDSAAAAASDRRRLEGMVASLEARLAQVRAGRGGSRRLKACHRHLRHPPALRCTSALRLPPTCLLQAQSELARSREEGAAAEQAQVTVRAELEAAQQDAARIRCGGPCGGGRPVCCPASRPASLAGCRVYRRLLAAMPPPPAGPS